MPAVDADFALVIIFIMKFSSSEISCFCYFFFQKKTHHLLAHLPAVYEKFRYMRNFYAPLFYDYEKSQGKSKNKIISKRQNQLQQEINFIYFFKLYEDTSVHDARVYTIIFNDSISKRIVDVNIISNLLASYIYTFH